MFFVIAKIFWAFVQPLSIVALLTLVTLLASLLRWRKTAIAASAIVLAIIGLAGWTTVGVLLLQPLESRFSRPDPLPERVAGIVLLGGAFEGGINLARGGYELNGNADRVVETAILARRYPEARIVVSGGSGSLLLEGEGDALTSARLFQALGIERERLILETRSRDTFENAVYSRELVSPSEGETWLLVTSAFHMPRSIGLFRKAGFDVVAWPADYRTKGTERFGFAEDGAMDGFFALAVAFREWTGLLAYWLSGRIDSLLPSPTAAIR